MRRWCAGILSFLLFLSISVPVFAVQLPTAEEKDGDTYLGTFKIAGESDLYRQFWDDWKHSDRNMMLAGAGGQFFWFFIVPEGGTLTISDAGGEFFTANFSKATDYIRFSTDVNEPGTMKCEEMGTISGSSIFANSFRYVVCGTYFNTVQYSFPKLSFDYLVDYPGVLHIVDDIEGETDDGWLGWLKNIWDWLSKFWEKLKALLISLFVPEDGYFTRWLKEIKEAFEEKTGGLSNVFEYVSDMFDDLKSTDFTDSSIKMKVPDNLFFPGYKGITVDLLGAVGPLLRWVRGVFNAIMVLFTLIICYRRLIAIIRQ